MGLISLEPRPSGIQGAGDLPWGSHIGVFRSSERDLLDVLVRFVAAGLRNDEVCSWEIVAPLTVEMVRDALGAAVPELARCEAHGQIELLTTTAAGGTEAGSLEAQLDRALLAGFDGLRVVRDAGSARSTDAMGALDASAGRLQVLAAFVYSRGDLAAADLVEAVQDHRFGLVWNAGRWDVLAGSEVRIARGALARSEEELQGLFRNMSEGCALHRIVLDPEGRPCDYVFLEINAAFERLTGLPARQVVGKRVTRVLPGIEQDPTDWIGRYGRVALTGEPVQFESYAEPLDKWFAVSAFSPHRLYFAVTFADITARKNAEAQRRAAEERLLVTLRSIGDAVISTDTEGRIVLLNRVAEELTGFTHAEAIGKPLSEVLCIVDERSGQPADDPVRRAIDAGVVVGLANHTALVRRDGTRISIADSAAPVQSDGGELLGVVLVFRDVSEERKAEKALARSEAQYRSLFENMTEEVHYWKVIRDVHGRIVTWRLVDANPPTLANWGKGTIDQIRGATADEILGPGATARLLPLVEKIMAEGASQSFDEHFPLTDRHFRFTSIPLGDHFMTTGADVSAVRRIARLYEVLSRVNESIVRTRDERTLFDQVCRILTDVGGFPLAWIGFVRGRDVAPVASAGQAGDYLRKIRVEIDGELGVGPTGTCIREGRVVVNDDFDANPGAAPWRTPAREHGFRASAAFPLRRDGRVTGALMLYASRPRAFDAEQIRLLEALCADVSFAVDAMTQERLRAEAERALQESELRFRLALRNAPVSVAAQDRDLRYIWAFDPGMAQPDEIVGRRDEEIFGSDVAARIIAAKRRVLEEGIDLGEQMWVDRPDGRVFLDVRWEPIRDETGQVTGVASAAVDLTAIKHAEEELRQANLQLAEVDRRKNEFLAVLSHELRNPLAPIANSLYVLDHAPPGGDQANRAKQTIGRQLLQLSNLVNDLLDVTRIARNKVQLQKERVELNELVRRAVEDNRAHFERAGVRLELSPAPRGVMVLADGTRVAQIVSNLLQNAAKFTLSGGTTRVTVSAEDRDAVVRVRDDGVGISSEDLSRLFQPFMQVDQTLDRSKGGLGLGLALVKGLVELHRGTVSAHSDGIDKGTEITVRLPLDAGAALEMSPSAPRQPAGSRRRVLIIEDNADAADSLREALELGDHEVEVAGNGPDGLAKARVFGPDVVLCDIGLPGMDGHEVARTMRADERLRDVYLVALSGYALPEDLQRASDAGFQRHLAKPPRMENLDQILAEAPRLPRRGGPSTPASRPSRP